MRRVSAFSGSEGQLDLFVSGGGEIAARDAQVSIGIETGPPIGSQKGPLPLVASGQRA